MYDILILGAGPAGISAALYAKRAGMKVLVLHYGLSELQKVGRIDNYYGFTEGITGEKLYYNGIEQAKKLGVEVLEKEITSIELRLDFSFSVKSEDEIYEAKSIIIATGNKRIKPNIKGIDEFEGKGISYCAVCDGFFYKNKDVVVIGNGKFAINEANDLKNIVSSVKIFTNGEKLSKTCEYEVEIRKIKEIHGKEKVTEIEFEDGERVNVDGVFVAQGIAGGNDFAKKLGIITNNNSIVIDENMQTNINGIFACGDITGGLLQVNKSVYEGAKAGLGAVGYVKTNKM